MAKWWCPDCGYIQDFEMTVENAKRFFPEIPNLEVGQCPSCRQQQLEDFTVYEIEREKDNQLMRVLAKIVGRYRAGEIDSKKALQLGDELMSARETELGLSKASIQARKQLQKDLQVAWEKYMNKEIDDTELSEACNVMISGVQREAWKLPWFKQKLTKKEVSHGQ